MIGPRDPVPQFGIPVNADTGMPLSERQVHHLQALKEAAEVFYSAMHDAEGSIMPGEHQQHIFQTRRMNIAATHFETAVMFARKAAVETP